MEQGAFSEESKDREWSRGLSSEAFLLINVLKNKSGSCLVDVGAGEGRHSIYAAQEGVSRVIAIERDPMQVRVIEERKIREDIAGLEIRCSEVLKELEGMAHNSLDGCIDCGMSHYVRDVKKRERFAQLIYEKLKVGGLYSITHFSEHETSAQGVCCASLSHLKTLFPEAEWDEAMMPWHEETWESQGGKHYAYKAVLRKRESLK